MLPEGPEPWPRPLEQTRFTDLDFLLPQTADELAELAFEPTDKDLGLELPLEEEGGGIAG